MFSQEEVSKYPIMMKMSTVAKIMNLSRPRTYDLLEKEGFPYTQSSPKTIRVPRDAFFVWLERQVKNTQAS